MSVYISGVEMPKEHRLYITLRHDGSVHVWDSYSGEGYEAQAIPVPEFGDLGENSEDVWKNLFALIALLLSDKERFDAMASEILKLRDDEER